MRASRDLRQGTRIRRRPALRSVTADACVWVGPLRTRGGGARSVRFELAPEHPMSPNLSRQPTAHSKVNMDDAEERAFWCGFFGIEEDELYAAVELVGAYIASLDHNFEGRAAASLAN
jgi:hypothetical protein